jgi:menaquinone-9 beta-reductase
VCGDGLIADAIGVLRRLNLYEEVCRLGFKTTISRVYSPSRICFDVPGEFLTLKRLILDDLIKQKAVSVGSSFLQGKVDNIEMASDGSLLLSLAGIDKPIRTRICFLATGANVDIAEKLGLVIQPGPSAVALRCYVDSPVVLDRLVISYDRSIIPGYAWIFPLGNNKFNIGCGVFYRSRMKARVNLRAIFNTFITSFPLAAKIMQNASSSTVLQGARLRCGLVGAKAVGSERILLIGETVGATFPFTGEGIGKAMETAEIAGMVTHEALISGDFKHLNKYADLLEYELRPKFLGYKIAEDWLSNPRLNDFVARRICRSKFSQDAVTGILNETVDPREVFSLRGILRSFFK